MNQPKSSKIARLIPLFVIGSVLNTLGIVFTSLGNVRFALMAVGLALMLAFLVKLLASRSQGSASPPAP
jgi:hypothetical protein